MTKAKQTSQVSHAEDPEGGVYALSSGETLQSDKGNGRSYTWG
jgi:hypothetical protein